MSGAPSSLPLEWKVPPKGADEVSPRSGASILFVSDGPISSNSGRNGGKNAGRNCVSALPQRATVGCDFPHLLAGIAFRHRCRIKGLCLRSPARRLARPLAPATVGVFRSYRRPLQAFPLMRSQGDGCPGRTSPSLPLEGKVPPKGADEASPPQRRKAPVPAAAGYFAPRRERFLCLRRPHFFQQRKKWGKERRQKLRFCTSSARYACSLPPALSLT